MTLKDDKRAYAIMGCAMRVHSELGCGFLESAYGDALEVEFEEAGIPYCREDTIQIFYKNRPLQTAYRADFTCFNRQYIIELKAIKTITKIDWAQVIHYIRATRIPYALLINFGRSAIQYDTFEREKLPSNSVIDNCRDLQRAGFCEASKSLRSGSESPNHRSSSLDSSTKEQFQY